MNTTKMKGSDDHGSDTRDIGIVRVVRQQKKKKKEKGAPRQLVCFFVIVRFFFLCLSYSRGFLACVYKRGKLEIRKCSSHSSSHTQDIE
jgi:hypothetical protein